jgi:hypothetical protein
LEPENGAQYATIVHPYAVNYQAHCGKNLMEEVRKAKYRHKGT